MKWNDLMPMFPNPLPCSEHQMSDCLHDVSLVTSDHSKVFPHKLVLSANSEYFRHNNNITTTITLILSEFKISLKVSLARTMSTV